MRTAHVYIRPSGAHALSLIDDLSADSLKRMKEAGFEPTVAVETSPGNFQAWLNHGRVLTRGLSLSTQAAMDGAAKRIAARPRSLPFPLRRARCGAPAAEPASAPALRATSLCHARTVRRRRIPEISRNPSDLGEGVAPQDGAVGRQASGHALAYGKRAKKGRSCSDGGMRCVQTKG